jgi:predicted NAD/FAD-dependent oxidoreductase
MTILRPHVAVIGAGMAGLSCARHLQDGGCRVTVFDKGRAPGGRMSTRRDADWQCDHGAQYFVARHEAFRQEVARWEAAGVASRWQPKLAVLGGTSSEPDDTVRFVGVPRMSAPANWLGAGLQVQNRVMIRDMQHDDAGWRLRSDELGLHADHYDALVLAVPAPQAAVLLEPLLPLTAMQARAVDMLPCWTLMVHLDHPHTPGYDAAFVNQGPLRWIARDGSKPGRQGGEVWVLQASADWSAKHIDEDEAMVAGQLLDAFARLGGPSANVVRAVAHRWRYAKAGAASSRRALWLTAVQVGLCGDWMGGGRVEDAWLSGREMAIQLLSDPLMIRQASAA